MNLTIHQALRLAPVFRNLLSTKLPVKLSYTMAKFARTLDDQLKTFNETKEKLITEAMVEGKLPEAEEARLNAELGELANEALTVELTPVKMSSLPDTLEISTHDMMVLIESGIIEE